MLLRYCKMLVNVCHSDAPLRDAYHLANTFEVRLALGAQPAIDGRVGAMELIGERLRAADFRDPTREVSFHFHDRSTSRTIQKPRFFRHP